MAHTHLGVGGGRRREEDLPSSWSLTFLSSCFCGKRFLVLPTTESTPSSLVSTWLAHKVDCGRDVLAFVVPSPMGRPLQSQPLAHLPREK